MMIFLFSVVFFFMPFCNSEPMENRESLLSFLAQMPHSHRIDWSSSVSACNWTGVRCDSVGLSVTELRLPGVGLEGPIPPGTLGRLLSLRILSLRGNRISGEIPPDFSNLTLLHGVFLQNNSLSGSFPTSLLASPGLYHLDLSGNRFYGKIPASIRNLTQLKRFYLRGNDFSGEIPDIGSPALESFDVSNNNLTGSIPNSLKKFPSSSFAGNTGLCGGPLPPCSVPPLLPPTSPEKSSKRVPSPATIVITVAVPSVFVAGLSLFLCLRRKRQGSKPGKPPSPNDFQSEETPPRPKEKNPGKKKLVFLESGVFAFELEDLLRASAEVLGKGSMGTSYKVVVEGGTPVVVKRLKGVVVSEEDFGVQMRLLGRIKHTNVVPLTAYYYSSEEKLILSEFMAAGSLSALLHGSRIPGRALLSWDQRLKIAVAAGRGLAHLHLSAQLVHGNVKSSNVLLRPNLDAVVSGHGLHRLVRPAAAHVARLSGSRAPEEAETGRPTFKSDVFSFGVLLLELLTGRPPNQVAVVGVEEAGLDLVRWVRSVAREEWAAEVFDGELMRYGSSEDEMEALLQVALACTSVSPDQRPLMEYVVAAMEEVEKQHRGLYDLQFSDDPSSSRAATSGSLTPLAPDTRLPPSVDHRS